VEALSVGAEFSIVIAVAFGFFILSSCLSVLLRGASAPGAAGEQITEGHLQFLLFYETAVLAALGVFLKMRGWTPDRLGLRLTPVDVLLGLVLAVVTFLSVIAVYTVLSAVAPPIVEAAQQVELVASGLRWRSVILVSLVNGLFEEVFVVGYVMSALRDRTTLGSAVSISLGIRMLYHFYQGTFGVVAILPFGVLLAYWYGRTGRLWPAIVAHAAYDFYALSAFAC
jgi:uncharacterized protein